MKNKDYKQLIVRKDLNQDERLKKNRSVRMKMLFASLVCLVATVLFVILVVRVVRVINIKTGIERRIEFEEMIDKEDHPRSIKIDIDEMFYIKDKGRTQLNGAKVFEFIFIIISALVFYAWLYCKLTARLSYKISEICSSLDNMALGEYDVRMDESGNDEFSRIAANINIISTKFNEVLEEERNTEAAKNELITSIAHDLRTPITSIIGYLDIITNKELDEQTKNKYISISYDKSLRLERLIEDLFTYTKFSLGQYPVNLSVLNFGKLMEQLIEEFYPQFMDEDLEYSYKCSGKIEIEADGELLARLFANLLSNSIKYGKDGKNIDISVEQLEDMACVKVVNYGQTIPEEELSRIFDKFYRVESSRSRTTGGTGLGLAIVKQIVDLHKGTIEVTSGVNGTVFTVCLPIKQ